VTEQIVAVLQRVAVCLSSVLQCVSLYCSADTTALESGMSAHEPCVLQCVAALCCSVSQKCFSSVTMLQCSSNVLQCVLLYCSEDTAAHDPGISAHEPCVLQCVSAVFQ